MMELSVAVAKLRVESKDGRRRPGSLEVEGAGPLIDSGRLDWKWSLDAAGHSQGRDSCSADWRK